MIASIDDGIRIASVNLNDVPDGDVQGLERALFQACETGATEMVRRGIPIGRFEDWEFNWFDDPDQKGITWLVAKKKAPP